MSHKEQHGNKQTKKSPAMSLKERRQTKAAKRHSKMIQQLFPAQT